MKLRLLNIDVCFCERSSSNEFPPKRKTIECFGDSYQLFHNFLSCVLTKRIFFCFRYIAEWEEILDEEEENEADDIFPQDSEIPRLIIPRKAKKVHKLLRMIIRVYDDLPLILNLCNSSQWIGIFIIILFYYFLFSLSNRLMKIVLIQFFPSNYKK